MHGERPRRILSVPGRGRANEGRRLGGASAGPADLLTVLTGRVKVVKLQPSGKDVILEIFGPGDPVGAVVAYEGRPFPATAIARDGLVVDVPFPDA